MRSDKVKRHYDISATEISWGIAYFAWVLLVGFALADRGTLDRYVSLVTFDGFWGWDPYRSFSYWYHWLAIKHRPRWLLTGFNITMLSIVFVVTATGFSAVVRECKTHCTSLNRTAKASFSFVMGLLITGLVAATLNTLDLWDWLDTAAQRIDPMTPSGYNKANYGWPGARSFWIRMLPLTIASYGSWHWLGARLFARKLNLLSLSNGLACWGMCCFGIGLTGLIVLLSWGMQGQSLSTSGFKTAAISGWVVMLCSCYWRLAPLSPTIRARQEDGLCVNCGYDLRGTVAGGRVSCPECGTGISLVDQQSRSIHSPSTTARPKSSRHGNHA